MRDLFHVLVRTVINIRRIHVSRERIMFERRSLRLSRVDM
jgi:hypothetical protein